ncbi:flagellar motor protein MotB [Bacillaceae bacterium SIJ1]|uniref:flagellar motor protein MotB n=1 Tax=Litoribacterium kuwaitense TaxID=1398745 RepID=UPI0013E9F719|nr:flagellar motor protein MotB [Litoribacterium kuwaitense]NGP45894.1 flagellar motor protein MotB [Litoribacterium kuwaitense]
MTRRKKKKESNHVDESWLIPYADLMTLLLALFIVLFSSSSIDAQKFQHMSEVFSDVFTGGTEMMEYSAAFPNTTTLTGKDPEGRSEGASASELEELGALKEKIDQYIGEQGLTGSFQTSLSEEGLLLKIEDSILFESGHAQVSPEYYKLAEEISGLLVMDPPRQIIISGHTDNVPIGSAPFESNWELSVMRAVNFMKLLVDNPALQPQWFSAKGFGEFHPVASNDTASGRQENRRVEVLILPRTSTTSSP